MYEPVPVITKDSPSIYVYMEWAEPPEGEISLWMKRVGDVEEFAYYPALEVWGNRITFMFDELLLSKAPGRYVGRLLVAGVHKADVYVQYVSATKVLSAENTNV